MNTVIRRNEFGDSASLGFIGVLPSEVDSAIHVYFRCKRHSIGLELHEKIQMYVKRGAEMTEEQGQELIRLSKESASEGQAARKFLVGSQLHPSLKFDGCTFQFVGENKAICSILWKTCSSNTIYPIIWLFQKLREASSTFESYSNLLTAFDQLVNQNPSRIRFIEELDPSGYGYFRRNKTQE